MPLCRNQPDERGPGHHLWPFKGNYTLYGSNGYLLDRLQSVLNSAARLILGVRKFDSISAAIRNELHWLSIEERIRFKIALLVRHCIVGGAPEYLTEICRPVSSSSGRQSLRSASRVVISLFRDSDYEDLATELLLSLGPMCGTLFRPRSDNRVTIYKIPCQINTATRPHPLRFLSNLA